MALVAATCRVLMVALMKKAAFLPANALARSIRVPALQTGALPEQSSYQSARDASIMTHSTGRISEDGCGENGAEPARQSAPNMAVWSLQPASSSAVQACRA